MESVINQYIGKRLEWSQIVGLFPDRWVALTDCEYDGADIKTGILRAVCIESELTDVAYILKGKGFKVNLYRTTELIGINIR